MKISSSTLKLLKALSITAALSVTSSAFAGADLIATKIRSYSGGGRGSVQVDLFNRGYSTAIGNDVRVTFPELGTASAPLTMYQYYGGTSTTPNAIKPNELGYVTFEVPANIIQHGQLVHVLIESASGAVASINTFAYACQKSSTGCE